MKILSDYPINEDVLNELSKILKDYEIIASKRINSNNKKEILTDSTSGRCRFCGKSYPEVKFEADAHAIPEFIGNKKLFSKYECDTCNKNYFNLFENEMANFMLPLNSISGTKVKNNKTPKYHQKGEPIIKFESSEISISEVPNSLFENLSEKSFNLPIKIPSHIPDYIYRCLVKIGLSIIQEELLNNYKGTIEWLMNINLQSNLKPQMLLSIYPTCHQMDEIVCNIFERKDDCIKNVPFSILFLSYRNYAFQTFIPYCSKERLNVKLRAFPFILPTNIDLNKNNKDIRTLNLIDLSSKVRKTDEILTLTITNLD